VTTSPDGRLSLERVRTSSRTDRYDDDETWELRVIDRETGAILETVRYFDNRALNTGARVTSEPREVGFSDDSRYLEIVGSEGQRERRRIHRPEGVAQVLTTPDGDTIEWSKVESTPTSIRYEVRWTSLLSTELLGIWEHSALRDPRTGGWAAAPVERMVLSDVPGILAVVREDGHVEGYHYDHRCFDDPWRPTFPTTPEGWFKGTLYTGRLAAYGDGTEPRSLLFVWANRGRRRLVTLMADRDLTSGSWMERPKPLMREFRFTPDFAVEIDYEDGTREVRAFRDPAALADESFGCSRDGTRAFAWDIDTMPGRNLQEIDLQVLDLRSGDLRRLELERPGLDVRWIRVDLDGPGMPSITLHGEDGPVESLAFEPDAGTTGDHSG